MGTKVHARCVQRACCCSNWSFAATAALQSCVCTLHCTAAEQPHAATSRAGTLFILQKDASLKEQLLDAVRRQQDDEVLALIDKLAESNPTPNPARSPKVAGGARVCGLGGGDEH